MPELKPYVGAFVRPTRMFSRSGYGWRNGYGWTLAHTMNRPVNESHKLKIVAKSIYDDGGWVCMTADGDEWEFHESNFTVIKTKRYSTW